MHPIIVDNLIRRVNGKVAEMHTLAMQIFLNPEATPEEVEQARQYIIRNPKIREKK